MFQGLDLVLALAALWLVAPGVCLRYNAGIQEPALPSRQRNGDADYDGLFSVTGLSQHCHAPGALTVEVRRHLEPEQECSFVTIPAPIDWYGHPVKECIALLVTGSRCGGWP